MRQAGMVPDPWQSLVLNSQAQQILINCSRQLGKSTISAALALKTAILEAPALVLILSPSERQSGETLAKIKLFHHYLIDAKKNVGRQPAPWELLDGVQPILAKEQSAAQLDSLFAQIPDCDRETALQLHLDNGSRIIGLPGEERTIRGYSGAALLVIDESSRVKDGLYRAVRPMMARSKGRIVTLSTPFGKRGWWFEEYERCEEDNRVGKKPAWQVVEVPATMCSHIGADFLNEELRALGDRWFQQEYMTKFLEGVDSVFPYEAIKRAMECELTPLFADG